MKNKDIYEILDKYKYEKKNTNIKNLDIMKNYPIFGEQITVVVSIRGKTIVSYTPKFCLSIEEIVAEARRKYGTSSEIVITIPPEE